MKKFAFNFVVIFLMSFMVLIFGPAELYFSNAAEFKFIYTDFAIGLSLIALVISLILTVVMTVIPKKISYIILSILLGLSVAGYLEVMFFNGKMDLLGVSPDGYVYGKNLAKLNIAIWIVIIASMLLVLKKKEEIWKKLVCSIAVALLFVQFSAYVSLFIGAPDYCFNRVNDNDTYLSGEKQFTVSSEKNIIVLVLDFFSNTYLEPSVERYPDLLEELNDFTYYDNDDCRYIGTFPSLSYMLCGVPVNPDISINQWTRENWNNEYTNSFYKQLKDLNYEVNVYTDLTQMLTGANSVDVVSNVIDNTTKVPKEFVVNRSLLRKTMTKLSCFRLFPMYLKPYVYVQSSVYQDIVVQLNNGIEHNNYSFYHRLITEGLKTVSSKNYYIMEHLEGIHVWDTSEECTQKKGVSMEETVKGCMVLVNEYLRQLKELGVYDNSTIIITADHGSARESQVVFFMKNAGEHHDKMVVSHAPISHTDFLPTIGKAAGIDYSRYGRAVSDIPENEDRERVLWKRCFDNSFPRVNNYAGESGAENTYGEYKYIGNIVDLLREYDKGPSRIIPMVDCFY